MTRDDLRAMVRRPLLIFAETYYPAEGGSERFAHNLALAATERGWEVTVYAPSMEGDGAFDVRQPYRVHRSRVLARLRAEDRRHGWRSRVARLAMSVWLSAAFLLRPSQPLVAVHLIPLAIPGAVLRVFGRRYTVLALGEEIHMGVRSPAMRWQVVRSLRGASRVFAISGATAAACRELGVPDRRLRFQYPTPDAIFFEPLAAGREALRRRLGISPETVHFASLSRLVERKGFDVALRAVARLLAARPGLPLVYTIAGIGPDEERLRRLASELGIEHLVRFAGAIDEHHKRDLLEAADLFLMPNRTLESGEQEGFGIVFVEAALRGTPSVGGRSGGTADALLEDRTGMLVDPLDEEGLAARLAEFVSGAGPLCLDRLAVRRAAHRHFRTHRRFHAVLGYLERRPRRSHSPWHRT